MADDNLLHHATPTAGRSMRNAGTRARVDAHMPNPDVPMGISGLRKLSGGTTDPESQMTYFMPFPVADESDLRRALRRPRADCWPQMHQDQHTAAGLGDGSDCATSCAQIFARRPLGNSQAQSASLRRPSARCRDANKSLSGASCRPIHAILSHSAVSHIAALAGELLYDFQKSLTVGRSGGVICF